MTTAFLREEGRQKAALLALQLLDPIGGCAAGYLGLRLTIPAVLSILHDRPGPSAAAVIYVGSAVLVLSSILVLVRLFIAGLGYTFVLALQTKPLEFGAGLTLIVANDVYPLGRWVDSTLRDGGVSATAALCCITVYAFGDALRRAPHWGTQFLNLSFAQALVRGANRSQLRALRGELYLCGGSACGVFRRRNVVDAPRQGELLLYGEHSARRGTLIVGSPGSSKTRSKVYPDLYWGLRSSPYAGALIFVTKRRATNDCYAIAKAFRPKEKIHVVGVGIDREHIDITARMTHEAIGDGIQDGLGTSHSDFWRHGPSAFVEGFIELAKALAPTTVHVPPQLDEEGNMKPGGEAYDLEITDTLPTLLKLISLDARRLDAVFDYGFSRAGEFETKDPGKAQALKALLHEVRERVLPLMQRDARLGEELRQSVLPQLQPFSQGPMRDAFCDRSGIDLGLLERGHVILIEADEAENPRAVGTIIRMVFRRLVQMARERTASDRVGLLNPIILLCDEYTNYAAPGHVQAWNTVRESNFCATIGITSVSALVKQLGGDRHAADAIIGNFANKFFFEIDDRQTRELARELVGKTLVKRRSTSIGKSRTSGSSSAVHGAGSHTSHATSENESLNEQLDEVLDGSVWRTLGAERDRATAIAFVRASRGVRTDVVTFGVLDPSEHIYTALPAGYGLSP